LEQLKQVGDRVPSQHWRPVFCGSLMEIVIERVIAPHAPVPVRVTLSVPLEDAV
jgi:hypothetical protein